MMWFFEHASCGATLPSYSVPGATLSEHRTRSLTFMKPSVVGFCITGSNPSHWMQAGLRGYSRLAQEPFVRNMLFCCFCMARRS